MSADRHPSRTLAVLTLASVVYAVLQSCVTTALPEIQRSLDTSTTGAAWVLTAFLLSAAVATPLAGRLGDMYGKQRVLAIVLWTLAAGTVLAALSESIAVLIVARTIQGISGGLLPLAFGIVKDELEPRRVPGGIGQVAATLGVGTSAGVVLSGVIVEQLSYHWLFWLPLGPLIAAAAAATWLIPASPIRTGGRIAWLSAALLSVGLAAILLAITQGERWGWESPRVLAIALTGLAVLAAWVVAELRTREPLVDMRMMRVRAVWTTNVAGILLAIGMFSSFLLIPQLALLPTSTGFGLGVTAIGAGLFLLPTAVLMLLAGMAVGPLQHRFGPKPLLVTGAAVSVTSFVVLLVAHAEPWHIYLASSLAGTGIGLSYSAMPNVLIEAVPPSHTGVVQAMNVVTRWVGGALGTQIAAAIIAASVGASGLPTEDGFVTAFAVTAAILVVGTAATALVPARSPDWR